MALNPNAPKPRSASSLQEEALKLIPAEVDTQDEIEFSDEVLDESPELVTATPPQPKIEIGGTASSGEVVEDEPEPQASAPAAQPSQPIVSGAGGQPVAPQPPQAQQPQVAQPAAQPDPWADYEEVAYNEVGPEGAQTFTVRAPKTYADKVKNAYARREIMDRHISYANNHRPWLEPLIADGSFNNIAPFVQDAIKDQNLANGLAQVYRRYKAGLPMFEAPVAAPVSQVAPQIQTQAPAVAAPPQQDPIAFIDSLETVDDYTKAALKAAMGPVAQRLAYTDTLAERLSKMEQTQTQYERQQQEAQQRQQEEQRQQQQRQQVEIQATQLLRQMYPDTFDPQRNARWQTEGAETARYARESGILDQYGYTPTAFVLAHQARLSPLGLMGVGQAQQAPPPSVAAAALQQVKAQAAQIAQEAGARATQQVAASVAPGGGGTPGESAPKKIKIPQFVKDPRTGNKRPMTANETLNWCMKNGVDLEKLKMAQPA